MLSPTGTASTATPTTSATGTASRGEAEVAAEPLAPGTLLYLGTGRDSIDISCRAAARLILIGGAPFHEEVLLWWNFVARTPEEMEQATRDWNGGQRFGSVRGSPSLPLVAPDPAGLRLRAPREPPPSA